MTSLLVTHKSVLIPFSCIVNTYFSEPMDILSFCIESINKFEDLRKKKETFKIDLNNSGLNGLTQGHQISPLTALAVSAESRGKDK